MSQYRKVSVPVRLFTQLESLLKDVPQDEWKPDRRDFLTEPAVAFSFGANIVAVILRMQSPCSLPDPKPPCRVQSPQS